MEIFTIDTYFFMQLGPFRSFFNQWLMLIRSNSPEICMQIKLGIKNFQNDYDMKLCYHDNENAKFAQNLRRDDNF